MKIGSKKICLWLASLMLVCSTVAMTGCSSATADPTKQAKAEQDLTDGNAKFLTGDFTPLTTNSSKTIMEGLAKNGQQPLTIVLSCSDSRVPPEILLNKGLGELFVIRVAGNVVDKHQLGSIEYAIEHLKSPVVLMVLGHSQCGAVKSTAEAVKTNTVINKDDNIGSILYKIKPAVDTAFKNYTGIDRLVDAAVDENVRIVAEEMKTSSKIIEEAITAGHVKLLLKRYDLASGKVSEVK